VWGDAALYFEDATGLESILTELVRNPDKLHGFRVAAAERAQHFTAKRMADRYTSLYRDLIVSSSGGKSKVQEELHAA
jgi:hypothetical protein